jgi:hypothetical protein
MIALLCALFEIFLGPELVVRRVSFRDRLTPGLAGYKSGALPLLRVEAAAYPAQGRGLLALEDVGLFGWYARSPVKSRTLTSDGSLAFETQEIAWLVGARYRVLLSGTERFAASLSYGSLRNDFAGPSIAGVLLPAGTIQYWRPGVEARFPFGAVALYAGLGYLAPARQDKIGAAFPRASSGGVDGELRAEVAFGALVVRAAARYLRFFYSLHPLPHDPYIAGGALDEVASVSLALGYRL